MYVLIRLDLVEVVGDRGELGVEALAVRGHLGDALVKGLVLLLFVYLFICAIYRERTAAHAAEFPSQVHSQLPSLTTRPETRAPSWSTSRPAPSSSSSPSSPA